MILRIKKDVRDVHVELVYSTGQKPVRQVLTAEQVEGIVKILQAALAAKTFAFELELS